MIRFIQSEKYPLFASFCIQLLGLFVFAIEKVQSFQPMGSNVILDTLYTNAVFITALYYLLSTGLIVTLILWRDRHAIHLLACGLSILSIFINHPWIVIILYPFLTNSNTRVVDHKNKDGLALSQLFTSSPSIFIGIAVLLGGFALMTIEIPFPHHVSVTDVLYIQSLSILLILSGVIVFVSYLTLTHIIIGRISFLNQRSARTLSIVLFFFCFFHCFANRSFNIYIQQFHLVEVPFMVSGLLTNIILFLFGPIPKNKSVTRYLTILHNGLTGRKFWIKFFVVFFLIRQLYIWLIEADQNFLTVFIYDLTNVIVPFLAFWLCLGLAIRLIKKNNYPALLRFLIIVMLIAGITPYFLFGKKSWTVHLEQNRSPARFFTSNGKRVIGYFGYDTGKESDGKARRFIDSIHQAKTDSNLSSNLVFGVPLSPIKKRVLTNTTPHIFLFVSDATYARRLSVYGYEKNTSPNLDEFAKEASFFEHFYSSSSATCQGIASLFTGYYIGNYPHRSKIKKGTLCKSLIEKGYTLLLSNIIETVSFSAEGSQCSKEIALSFDKTIEENWKPIEKALATAPQTPLFVYLHMPGGHDPWTLRDEDKIFGKEKTDVYEALLYKADRQFGRLLEKLKEQGIYKSSIIIFTADHGIGLGRHLDQVAYSNLYNVNTQVPFLIKVPGLTPSRISNYYSLIDVRPSLEQLLEIKNNESVHGISFVNELLGDNRKINRCVFGTATYKDTFSTQCSSGLKIIYQRDLRFVNVFNTKSDPYELTSISDELTVNEFMKLANPFIQFMAFGKDSYAFQN